HPPDPLSRFPGGEKPGVGVPHDAVPGGQAVKGCAVVQQRRHPPSLFAEEDPGRAGPGDVVGDHRQPGHVALSSFGAMITSMPAFWQASALSGGMPSSVMMVWKSVRSAKERSARCSNLLESASSTLRLALFIIACFMVILVMLLVMAPRSRSKASQPINAVSTLNPDSIATPWCPSRLYTLGFSCPPVSTT